MKYLFTTFIILISASQSLAQLYSMSATEMFVYFESDVHELTEANKDLVKQRIIEIGGTNIKEIYVEGHTDSFATNDYNDSLAFNRAESVRKYLGEMGIPERFIKMESFGETKLVSDQHEENRRARLFIVHETDMKNAMYPPKFIQVRCIDKQTRKPIEATVGFEYGTKDMRFSRTNKLGKTPSLPILEASLTLTGEADRYLSAYVKVSQEELEKPIDTLVYTLELIPVQVVGKFTFNNIYFYTDKDVIRPESEPELHKLLAILQVNKSAYIEIQGHMNYPINRPNNPIQARYNRELSYKRAKAINDYLVTAGIEQSRLTFKGMSNSRMKFPLPSSRAEEDQNKRVEIYTLKERAF